VTATADVDLVPGASPTVPTVGTPVTASAMRAALGRFATGVVIITAVDDGEPVGFACQSFASVSLDPPLVLFCADRGGRSWARVRRAGRFTANVLSAEQRDLCSRFGSRDGRRYDGLAWSMSRWLTPSLPGVLARVHCEIDDVHTAGDHHVVIGAVRELETPQDAGPLVYFRGSYDVPGIPGPEALT
jgi:3-hydroxy-9,10-secoandrosta-1,3,5(10)-triene-9,17-dione monooxygenase reductase component